MGNNNKQNKNQSADSQTTAANGDEQKTDTATPATVQPADTQQNADTAQPATTEPPNGDTNAGNNNADNGVAPSAPVVPELPPANEKGGGKSDDAGKTETAAKTVTMTLRHKSHTPHYHRCGLTLTKVFADYEVPEDCVERIKGDKWIEVKGAK